MTGSKPKVFRIDISSSRWMQILMGLLAACLLLGIPSQAARAQSGSSCQQLVGYLDTNNDGRPEAMVLACQFAPDTRDQLTIYKQPGTIQPDTPWQKNITYENETWVFDHGSRGKASLIINFRKEDRSLIAELYDDRSADGEVSYAINNGKILVNENRFWTVQVTAPDGWWLREGALNYNLHIQIDGDVEGMFMMEAYRQYLKTDGKPDYEIQIYDQNQNGKPEMDRRRILADWLRYGVVSNPDMP